MGVAMANLFRIQAPKFSCKTLKKNRKIHEPAEHSGFALKAHFSGVGGCRTGIDSGAISPVHGLESAAGQSCS
jgi:hypothetical protein